MENKELEKVVEEIKKLEDDELSVLFAVTYNETIKREAKKMILQLVDQQK